MLFLTLLASSSNSFGQDGNSVMPEFPGGMDSLQIYLRYQLQYPDSAVDAGVEGTVFVGLDVDTTGKVTNVIVKRGIPGANNMNREAIRLISSMPVWKPGTLDGKAVNVSMTLPVRFLISTDVSEQRKKEIKEQKKADKNKSK